MGMLQSQVILGAVDIGRDSDDEDEDVLLPMRKSRLRDDRAAYWPVIGW